MKLFFYFVILMSISSFCWANQLSEPAFVVIIPSYNNICWYEKNLGMLFAQNNTYQNWRAIYIDDCSTDGTGTAVENYIFSKGYQNRILIIHNEQRQGMLYNVYHVIHNHCADHEIVVICDGDDWFAHDRALLRVAQEYKNPDVWMTYGQFVHYPFPVLGICGQLPTEVIKQNAYRYYRWMTSALRTFYAGLFKKICQQDLMLEGKFFDISGDAAYMFPMLEMAHERSKFISDILYVYNCDNPINDFRIAPDKQLEIDHYIRHLSRYTTIDTLFVKENS